MFNLFLQFYVYACYYFSSMYPSILDPPNIAEKPIYNPNMRNQEFCTYLWIQYKVNRDSKYVGWQNRQPKHADRQHKGADLTGYKDWDYT